MGKSHESLKLETRTNHGLNEVFGTEDNIGSLILLSVSIVWSCFSCALAHIKGLMVSRDHFPAFSKLTVTFSLIID